jgi:hypothetical protein
VDTLIRGLTEQPERRRPQKMPASLRKTFLPPGKQGEAIRA